MSADVEVLNSFNHISNVELFRLANRIEVEIRRRRLEALKEGAAQSKLTEEQARAYATSTGQHNLNWPDYCKVQMLIDVVVVMHKRLGIRRQYPAFRVEIPSELVPLFST